MKRGDPPYSDCRWCEGCEQYHGPLYPCKKYAPELLKIIEKKNQKFIRYLNNDTKLPPLVRDMFLMFAGE